MDNDVKIDKTRRMNGTKTLFGKQLSIQFINF